MQAKFKIEEQYRLYLKRMNLSESTMHPIQKKQLKQTFFGAFGQLLILMRDDIAALPEAEGVEVLDAQMKEVVDFFKAEVAPLKGKNIEIKPKGTC